MEVSKQKNGYDKETSRIESFSDGVFAIAITLLILDVHVPVIKGNETLMKSLAGEWTGFLAFLIGFLTLLICWINHHYMFQLIHRSNGTLLLLNGFKLLIVTITPFATALLSKYIQTPWEATAVNIYSFNFALMGIAMTVIWLYAQGKGFVKAESHELLSATKKLYILSTVIPSFIWFISFFSITGSLVLFCIMFFIFLFPKQTVTWLANRSKH